MNERGHVVNAVLLSVGLAVIFNWGDPLPTVGAVLSVGIPITLGALFPDVDTSFGTHRQTLHNLGVLGAFMLFPLLTGNLHYVWIGVATHYVLDLMGNVKGMALLYPHRSYYDVPVGVPVTSRWADVVTLAVTAFELLVVGAVVLTGTHEAVLGAVEPVLADLAADPVAGYFLPGNGTTAGEQVSATLAEWTGTGVDEAATNATTPANGTSANATSTNTTAA